MICFLYKKIDILLFLLFFIKMDRLMRAEQLVCSLEKELMGSHNELNIAKIKYDIEKKQFIITFVIFILYIIFG